MRFLGPVTELGDRMVRPHDLRITTEPFETAPSEPGPVGAVTGRISRIVRVGFEARVEITAGAQVVTVTLPCSEFIEVGLRLDDVVAVPRGAAAEPRRGMSRTTIEAR
jgi:sulfate transport system ATP-binding protein